MKQLILFLSLAICLAQSFQVKAQNSNRQSAFHYDKPSTSATDGPDISSFDQCTMDTNQYKIAIVSLDGIVYNLKQGPQIPHAQFINTFNRCRGKMYIHSRKEIKELFNFDLPEGKKVFVECYCKTPTKKELTTYRHTITDSLQHNGY